MKTLILGTPFIFLLAAAGPPHPPPGDWCEIEALPSTEAPLSIEEHARIEQPAHGRVEIDVLFVASRRTHSYPYADVDWWLPGVNDIYRTSGIDVTFRSVGVHEMPSGLSSLDSGSNPRPQLLSAMRTDSAVARMREDTGADIVVGLFGSGGGGRAFMWQRGVGRATARAWAFAVVGVRSSRNEFNTNNATWLLAHELGHVLGLGHQDDATVRPFVSYGRGYAAQRWVYLPSRGFRARIDYGTVMSTVNWPTEGVFRFSTNRTEDVEVGYGDSSLYGQFGVRTAEIPLGDSEHDSRRAIRATMDDVAGFNSPPEPGLCKPTTDVLELQGGYRVRMCWTADGATGQARAGVWASSNSGILWFFNRDNAEVLIKVLDGCNVNGRVWVFVAPVTDLAFNLVVTAPSGTTWNYTNSGGVAQTRADTAAFQCDVGG